MNLSICFSIFKALLMLGSSFQTCIYQSCTVVIVSRSCYVILSFVNNGFFHEYDTNSMTHTLKLSVS